MPGRRGGRRRPQAARGDQGAARRDQGAQAPGRRRAGRRRSPREAVDGVVVDRVDGLERDTLRDLARRAARPAGLRAVVLGAAPEGGGAALVARRHPGQRLRRRRRSLEDGQDADQGRRRQGPAPRRGRRQGRRRASTRPSTTCGRRPASTAREGARPRPRHQAHRRGAGRQRRARWPRPTRWSPARGDRARDHRAHRRRSPRRPRPRRSSSACRCRSTARSGPAATAGPAEADELAAATGLPVETWDERLTTVTADRDLMALDMEAGARRRVVDKVAAAVMLQAWLDHRRLDRRPRGPRPMTDRRPRRLQDADARRPTSTTSRRRVRRARRRRYERRAVRRRASTSSCAASRRAAVGSSPSCCVLLVVAGAALVGGARRVGAAPDRPAGLARASRGRSSIPEGSTSDDIGELLADEGVIASDFVWDWYLRVNGGGPFQAGDVRAGRQQRHRRRRSTSSRPGPRRSRSARSRCPRASPCPRSSTASPTPRTGLGLDRADAAAAPRQRPDPLARPAGRPALERGHPLPRDLPVEAEADEQAVLADDGGAARRGR